MHETPRPEKGMKRFWLFILSFFLLIFLPGLQSHNPISPHSVNELADLAARGITHRFLDNDLIELQEEWSGQTFVGSLRELDIEQIYAWADTEGVPILEIDPVLIDTTQFNGWYLFLTEVPISSSPGVPVVMDDTDGDGKAEVYGSFKDWSTPQVEPQMYEIDQNGGVEFGHSYAPNPGVARLRGDSDQDSLKEVFYSFGGLLYNYEQQSLDSFPIHLRFIHQRHQGGISAGATEHYLGPLDGDNFADLLYKGSVPDSTDSTEGIAATIVSEYSPDSVNFVQVWSKTYVPGPQTGIEGFPVDDFDEDGQMDFMTADGFTGQVFVTENVGDDTFVETWKDSTPFVNFYASAGGDLDDDGKAEFFVGASTSSGHWILVYEADSNNSYSLQFLFHLHAGGVFDFPVYHVSDTDDDGKIELVVLSGAYIHVIKGENDNSYSLFYLKYTDNSRSVQVYDEPYPIL